MFCSGSMLILRLVLGLRLRLKLMLAVKVWARALVYVFVGSGLGLARVMWHCFNFANIRHKILLFTRPKLQFFGNKKHCLVIMVIAALHVKV